MKFWLFNILKLHKILYNILIFIIDYIEIYILISLIYFILIKMELALNWSINDDFIENIDIFIRTKDQVG